MTGEPVSDLHGMLAGMDPALDREPYRFAVLEAGEAEPDAAFAIIREAEAVTAIVPAGGEGGACAHFARITLQVHSALEGVGLTAAVAQALAEAQLPCNVIAGYHHDHVFVPWDRRDQALAILKQLSQAAGR